VSARKTRNYSGREITVMEENLHLEMREKERCIVWRRRRETKEERRKGRETRTDGVNKTQMKGWRGYREKKGGQEKREVEKNVN
jgi:hypothetical protein